MNVATPHMKYNLKKNDKSFTVFTQYDHEEKSDISLRKKVEKLIAEKESLKAELEEKEKYKETVDQAVHDIRTPLSLLLMGLKTCKSLHEKERMMLKNSIERIKKIADCLLESPNNDNDEQEDQHILVSQVLQDVIDQKNIQYNDKNIDFQYSFDRSLQFSFIYGNHLNFERMINNIINNSVEAFDDKNGTVKVEFFENDQNIKIIIQDNGSGMPKEVADKLMRGESVSTTKVNGHGIGTQQIRNALAKFCGTQLIESEQGVGTKITLTIPKSDSPKWVMKKLYLSERDVVVILDSDVSIHQKWKKKLGKYSLDLKFFTDAQEAIDFINSYPCKSAIRLLSDYELREQELNGLDVVQKCDLGKYRTSIISDSYSSKEVQDKAAELDVSILPKALLDIVPIDLDGKIESEMSFDNANVIVIDDDAIFASTISEVLNAEGLIVDTYYDPQDLISNLSKYSANIRIVTDNCFKNNMSGNALVEHFHEKGFKNVCVFSGHEKRYIESKYPLETEFITKGVGDIDEVIFWCKKGIH